MEKLVPFDSLAEAHATIVFLANQNREYAEQLESLRSRHKELRDKNTELVEENKRLALTCVQAEYHVSLLKLDAELGV